MQLQTKTYTQHICNLCLLKEYRVGVWMCEGVNVQCHFLSYDWHTSVGTYPNRTTHPVTLPEDLCQNKPKRSALLTFSNHYLTIMRKHLHADMQTLVPCFCFDTVCLSSMKSLRKRETEYRINNAFELRCCKRELWWSTSQVSE